LGDVKYKRTAGQKATDATSPCICVHSVFVIQDIHNKNSRS